MVAIPARLGATRLPRKPLLPLAGRPMIAHVIDRALAAGAREVVVATDADEIAQVAIAAGVRACLTRADHPSGTDRLAEAAVQCGWSADTIVVNLQGDEPLAPASGIREVARVLAAGDAPVSTLATPVDSVAQLLDPNVVKVVRDVDGRALYFTRAPVPWARAAFASGVPHALPAGIPFLRHIGIYGYRAGFLAHFTRLAPGVLERAESLEQLRVLEAGHAIAVGIAPEPFPGGVDTQEDVDRVAALLRAGLPHTANLD